MSYETYHNHYIASVIKNHNAHLFLLLILLYPKPK